MTPDRLRACLDLLRWSATALAVQVERDPKQVRRWLQGADIPPEVARWLEVRAKHAERTPPPRYTYTYR
jgi:hypothetical protein